MEAVAVQAAETAPVADGKADGRNRWSGHPGAAFAVRLVVLLGPAAVAIAVSVVASHLVGEPRALAGRIAWLVGIIGLSTVLLVATDRAVRRLLPLAALLRLSLVFPDRAPSRFGSALRTSSVRTLERRVREAEAGGVEGETVNDAAIRLVELAATLTAHDRRTRGHSERVRAYAVLIAEELGLSEEDHNRLQWGAMLHDIGKVAVPGELLNKRGRPTDEEWAVIRTHPAQAETLLAPVVDWLGPFANAAWEHHERFDGQGYPLGLAADAISLSGRIVAVADAFEVMTATRSYKKPMPAEEARAELTRCAGTHFDPVVVRALLGVSVGRLHKVMGPASWLVELPFLGWTAGLSIPTAIGALARAAIVIATLHVAAPSLLPTLAGADAAAASRAHQVPARSAIAATTASATAAAPGGAGTATAQTGTAGGAAAGPVLSGTGGRSPLRHHTAGPTGPRNHAHRGSHRNRHHHATTAAPTTTVAGPSRSSTTATPPTTAPPVTTPTTRPTTPTTTRPKSPPTTARQPTTTTTTPRSPTTTTPPVVADIATSVTISASSSLNLNPATPVSYSATVSPAPTAGSLSFTTNAGSIPGCSDLSLAHAGRVSCTYAPPASALGTLQVFAIYNPAGAYLPSGAVAWVTTVDCPGGLPHCDLAGLNLEGAVLTGADLAGADLAGADLSVADLAGANLSGANLTGTNFNEANLTGADLYGAIGANTGGAITNSQEIPAG